MTSCPATWPVCAANEFVSTSGDFGLTNFLNYFKIEKLIEQLLDVLDVLIVLVVQRKRNRTERNRNLLLIDSKTFYLYHSIIGCPERLCVDVAPVCAADEEMVSIDDAGCKKRKELFSLLINGNICIGFICPYCKKKNNLCGAPLACPAELLFCKPDEDLIAVNLNG